MGNVKLLKAYAEVGLDIFIILKNASPHIMQSMFSLRNDAHVSYRVKSNRSRQKKKCFIYFINNFKTPKLRSHQSGQSYIVSPPNQPTNQPSG